VIFGEGFLGTDGVIIVVILAVLIFGGKAIPKFARNLGSAKTEFEKGLREAKSTDTPPSPPTDSSAE